MSWQEGRLARCSRLVVAFYPGEEKLWRLFAWDGKNCTRPDRMGYFNQMLEARGKYYCRSLEFARVRG